jgi:hypothetical protein
MSRVYASEKQAVERKAIALSCERGDAQVTTEIRAYVCGCLALHKSVGRGKGYTLTHLPSGIGLAFGLRGRISDMVARMQDLETVMDWSRVL